MKKLFFLLFVSFFSAVHANEKIIVVLDWFMNPNHAPLFVAKEEGYFKDAGLDVEFINPSNPSDPPKLVAAQKADIAITYEPSFLIQIDKGLPLIRIGTLVEKPLTCLAALDKSSIRQLSDLKHKKIGYSTSGVNAITLQTMLMSQKMTLDDVSRINVHYDLTQALLSGKVDAVTGMMRTFEPIQIQKFHETVQLFYPEEYGVPTYSELILVANKQHVHELKFKKFMDALQKGEHYLEKHPESTWNQFKSAHPELNDEWNHLSWNATLPYFAKNPNLYDAKTWIQFANYLQKNHLIQTIQPVSIYAIDLTQGNDHVY